LSILHTTGSTTPLFVKETAQTSTPSNNTNFQHKTSGNMADGFGVFNVFTAMDSSLVQNIIGSIGFIRDGADNEGAFIVKAGTNGLEEFMRITNTGDVGIGTASPGDRLTIQGDSGSQVSVGVYTGDGDGTDNTTFAVYLVGTPGSITNRERLLLQGLAGNQFRFRSDANGTGTLRPLVFETGTNSNQIRLGTGGAVYINDTANANMTIGLTINQGANDDEALTLKSPGDVSHGMTSLTETDTFLALSKATAAGGGIALAGYSDSNLGINLLGRVTTDVTTKTTGSTGAITLTSQKKSGTSVSTMGANANLVVMRNSGTARWILDAEGDIFYGGSDDGAITDDYDDVQLLSGFRALKSPKDSPAARRFKGFLKETEDILIQQGVLTAPLDDGGLVSDTGLKGLLIDAIHQLNGKIDKLEAQLNGTN
jgi:hypothetical protein